MAASWHRAEIVFRADDDVVEKLMAAVSGQDIIEIGHLEVSECSELLPLDEPRPTGLHAPRAFGD